MVFSFAVGGLFLVGNNVSATDSTEDDIGVTMYQSMGYCGWGWKIKLCCTTTPRPNQCTHYECMCR